jgi:hypothetical protein
MLAFTACACAVWLTADCRADEPQRPRESLSEPLYRVAKNVDEKATKEHPPHTLDPALRIARSGLDHIQADVKDYTARLVKRERIDGKLLPQEFADIKIRNRKVDADGNLVVPFSVYMKFVAPEKLEGREVIYVENENEGKIVGHAGGRFVSAITVYLDPNGAFAMMDQRYPVTELGIQVLTERLIEKGERDRQGDWERNRDDETKVDFYKDAKINDRVCTLLRVTHPQPRPYYDFHVAQIFIDDELNVPIHYSAYSWPAVEGGHPLLEEEYTYMDVKVNVGLTDKDFDPRNPAYSYKNP